MTMGRDNDEGDFTDEQLDAIWAEMEELDDKDPEEDDS
jgi:hypothetical protein